MKINNLTIKKALKKLKQKKISATELTNSSLNRIKNYDSNVKAYLSINEKEAINQAKRADKEISNDQNVFKQKPLIGIPIALKDLFCTKNMRTTAGSKVLENYHPVYDATVVNKLKNAGAIILGKTNLDAWAHGASGENSDFFPTKNPWNLKYVPGGSSSGSAAALAYNSCLMATGTDTGGSVRFPAGFCNVVGLKPTYGRVSRNGIIAMASSLDSIGHFTKTVYDSAIVLSVTAGKDPKDATTTSQKPDDYLSEISSFKAKDKIIGIPKEYFSEGIDIEIKEIVKRSIKQFDKLGCSIKEVSLPHTKYAIAVYYIIQPSEVSSNLARYDGIRYGEARTEFGDEAKRRIMLGTYTLSSGYYDAYYKKAMKVRTLIRNDFKQVFKEVDLLLSPTAPFAPFRLGDKVKDPLKMYLCDVLVSPASLAGLPALSIPSGFTKKGLPVGMQITGPQFSENLLFQAGYAYQQQTNWHKKVPDLIKND
jgi:aspartyl-tRNA(Asn)/glutamyl-tRNA(Gln) amidotransferase subunit A